MVTIVPKVWCVVPVIVLYNHVLVVYGDCVPIITLSTCMYINGLALARCLQCDVLASLHIERV